MQEAQGDLFLSVRNGSLTCALPLAAVSEIMRPLSLRPLGSGSAFVLGLATWRGRPSPVVDLRALLGCPVQDAPGRFVGVRAGGRPALLAVDRVDEVRRVEASRWGSLPPLIRKAGSDTLAAVAALDDEFLLLLKESRLVPDEAWQAVDRGARP